MVCWDEKLWRQNYSRSENLSFKIFANMITSKSSQKRAFIWDTSFIINAKSWKLKEIFKSFLPLLSKTNLDQLIYEFQQNFAVVSFATFLGHQIFSNPLPASSLMRKKNIIHNGHIQQISKLLRNFFHLVFIEKISKQKLCWHLKYHVPPPHTHTLNSEHPSTVPWIADDVHALYSDIWCHFSILFHSLWPLGGGKN